MSNAQELYVIKKIANNEFRESLINPFMVFVGIIILIFTILNSIRTSYSQNALQSFGFIFVSIGNEFYIISMLCTIVAAFTGVMAVASERNGSLRILLTKPVYRRDIVIGKFLGTGFSVFALIVFSTVSSSMFLMLFYGMPEQFDEFVVRQCVLIAIMSIECALVTAVTMLVGIIFDNILLTSGVAATYFFVEWYANPSSYIKEFLYLSPRELYLKMVLGSDDISLNNASTALGSWVSYAMPYLALLVAILLVVIAINCYVFTNKE